MTVLGPLLVIIFIFLLTYQYSSLLNDLSKKIVNYFNDQLIIQIIEIILVILFSAQSVTKRSVNLNIAVMQYLKS